MPEDLQAADHWMQEQHWQVVRLDAGRMQRAAAAAVRLLDGAAIQPRLLMAYMEIAGEGEKRPHGGLSKGCA